MTGAHINERVAVAGGLRAAIEPYRMLSKDEKLKLVCGNFVGLLLHVLYSASS
jgi:hypothetical protein